MKVYLSGPMRGIPDFNFPAFDAAAAYLRSQGHEVFNPAEKDREHDPTGVSWKSPTGDITKAEATGVFDRRVAIRADLDYIIDHADAIALLPGWFKSKGANAELWLARFLDLTELHLSPTETGIEELESVNGRLA
jgi:Domain of unknown function (DUF4406)